MRLVLVLNMLSSLNKDIIIIIIIIVYSTTDATITRNDFCLNITETSPYKSDPRFPPNI